MQVGALSINASRVVVLAWFLAGCKPTEPPSEAVEKTRKSQPTSVPGTVNHRPLAPRDHTHGGDTLFQHVSAHASGLDFVHQWAPRNLRERDQIATAFAGGGVALGDIDRDGLPEVFLTRPHGGSRLYQNLGDFQFEDITKKSGLADTLADHWSTGATFVDFQGDGHLDLYVCGYDVPNKLFINNGNETFEERGAEFGLDFSGASLMMSFADYDRDGDLDAHLLTNRLSGGDRPEGVQFQVVDGIAIAPAPYRDEVGAILKKDGSLHPFDAGQSDRLYQQDGESGRFTDVTERAGLRGHFQGLSATWWDYDADGWLDLYVANDFFGPDHLYHNNQDGTFTDVIAQAVPHTPWFSMGSDAGDLNGDGRLDLIATDMAATTYYKQKVHMGDMDAEGWFLETPTPRQYMRNTVYINSGTHRFIEAAQMTGLDATDWTWAVRIADFDNDGLNDVFFSNGMTRQFFHADVRAEVRELRRTTGENRWSDYPPLKERNRFFRNRGRLSFQDVSQSWGIDKDTVSFGAATGDLDGDGDLDLVVNDFEEAVGLYRNQSTEGHVLVMTLRGADKNPHAIGAQVRLETPQADHIRLLQPIRGFLGCDPNQLLFGLGNASMVTKATILWPSGREQVLKNLEVDRHYHVVEPEVAAPTAAPPPGPEPYFVEQALPPGLRHRDPPFDDFAVQPLLPNKLSLLGPAMAWGDLDGNGKLDCFLGGAAGEPAQLWLQSPKGTLHSQKIPFFQHDARHEDVDALLFDADGDHDLDLYVVSGSVEGTPEANDYQDRLYLSVANGLSTSPDNTLPDMNFSGSCVAAGDIDGDGDIDLFVGARVIPGKYPTSGSSRLLRNEVSDQNNEAVSFTDATATLAPELAQAGMVTDAEWGDIDGDGDPDLMVTTEYGPVRCYRNEDGRLTEITDAAGLTERLGWWTTIAASDVDRDGDLDFAVGNFGWNTKYHPSQEHPQYLYYGDFDGRGTSYCRRMGIRRQRRR